HQVLLRHQIRDQGLADRHHEGPGNAGNGREGEKMPETELARADHERKNEGGHDEDYLGGDQQLPAFETIGRHATEGPKDEHREGTKAVDCAEHEGGAGELVSEPAKGHLLYPLAGAHEKGAEPQKTKVAVVERAESAEAGGGSGEGLRVGERRDGSRFLIDLRRPDYGFHGLSLTLDG